MDKITNHDMVDIALGAAILGSGGGGNPYMGRLIAQQAIKEYGPVTVVNVSAVPHDAFVVPVAFVGSPTVFLERLVAGDEIIRSIKAMSEVLRREPTHLMAAEIGGVNATAPFSAAAVLGLPLVDADLLGRAFPELHMILPTLRGIAASPLVLADGKGNITTVFGVDNPWVERIGRAVIDTMGGSVAAAFATLYGQDLPDVVVTGSLTRACAIGRAVRAARDEHENPIEAARAELSGTLVFTGKIIDVDRRFKGDFVRGWLTIEGSDRYTGDEMTIHFQNEYLLAVHGSDPVVTTPDLICLLETNTAEPLSADIIRYGARVSVVAALSDPRWRTKEGLKIVGPGYFGYRHQYAGTVSGSTSMESADETHRN